MNVVVYGRAVKVSVDQRLTAFTRALSYHLTHMAEISVSLVQFCAISCPLVVTQ
jgi:hypothetical protein